MLKTGKEWSIIFGISFDSLSGWFSEKDFYEEPLSRWEFLNRASQCKIIQPQNISRIDANKYKQKIHEINGEFSKNSDTKTKL